MQNSYLLGGITTNESSTAAISIRIQINPTSKNVIREAVTYTEHAKRKTVTAMDVVYALKRQGRTSYGFGG